jgi:hypothetical protein
MEINLFEIATRRHLKFPSPAGLLSTEDLWTLPLVASKVNVPNLNVIAQSINAELKKTDGEVDFVNPGSSKGSTRAAELGLMLDVVKHIISVMVAEQQLAKTALDRKEQKAKIMALIDKKREESLSSKSEEELTKLLQDL